MEAAVKLKLQEEATTNSITDPTLSDVEIIRSLCRYFPTFYRFYAMFSFVFFSLYGYFLMAPTSHDFHAALALEGDILPGAGFAVDAVAAFAAATRGSNSKSSCSNNFTR